MSKLKYFLAIESLIPKKSSHWKLTMQVAP